MQGKSISRVYREVLPDESPDTSYLEQDEFVNELAALERGDFGFVGVRAVAEVAVNGIAQTISSPGLWGIQSNSDESYFDEVYRDELATLADILGELGFSVWATPVLRALALSEAADKFEQDAEQAERELGGPSNQSRNDHSIAARLRSAAELIEGR